MSEAWEEGADVKSAGKLAWDDPWWRNRADARQGNRLGRLALRAIPAGPIAWRCATGCPAPGRARRVVGRVDRVRRTLIYASASIDKLSDRARIAEATATLMAVPTKLTAPR